MIQDIVLIGPMRAGKSTLAALLADKLRIPHASLDSMGTQYYLDAGLDVDRLRQLKLTEGDLASYRYFERFLLPALERHLRENRDCVIDLGAGHTVYEDEATFARVQEILAPYQNVVLVLPTANLDESAAILRERTTEVEWLDRIRERDGIDFNDWFLRHRSNFELAKYRVYTEKKSPEESCREILELLGLG